MCIPFLSAFLYFCAYSPFTIRNFRNALRKLRFIFWNISFQVKRKFRRDLKNERTSVGLNCFCVGRFYICFFSVLSCSFCRFSYEYDNSVTSVGAFRRCHRRTWLKPTFYFHFEIMGRLRNKTLFKNLHHSNWKQTLALFFKIKYTTELLKNFKVQPPLLEIILCCLCYLTRVDGLFPTS